MSSKYEKTKLNRARDIELKKYHCADCNKSFKDSYDLTRHLNGMIHNKERYVKYECYHCNFSSRIKTAYAKHLTSKKHIKRTTE